jgi:hypothetical protein
MPLLSPFTVLGRDYVITESRGTRGGLPSVSYFVSLDGASALLTLVWEAGTKTPSVEFQDEGFEARDLLDIEAHVMNFVPRHT